MESIYTKLALDGSKNRCARTSVFSPISVVCNGTVLEKKGSKEYFPFFFVIIHKCFSKK